MAKVKKKKKKRFSFIKTLLLIILILVLLSSIAFAGIIIAMVKTSPKLDLNQILTLNETSKLYDGENNYMDNVLSDQKRIPITIDNIPNDLKNAFISIEDERFYTHKGIDPKRVLGAAFINAKNKLARQNKLQGASTITQQLIKNTLLTPKTTIERKVQEMYLAIQLEKALDKNKILQAYLNTIYLGRGAWGVGAASTEYFNKDVSKLTLTECAYLAGVTQSPSVYDAFSPSSQKNPSIYLNRTKIVLSKMLENGYINTSVYNATIADINKNGIKFTRSQSKNKMNYEWFSREVIKQVRKDLKAKCGYDDAQINSLLTNGGLKIYTTMDKNIQKFTTDTLNNIPSILGISEKTEKGIIEPQASAVIMDYHNGEVKAIVGGRGEQPALSYNRATEDPRPIGSTIKPLSIYGPAIDTKLATASSIIDDSPLSQELGGKFPNPDGSPYNPRNDDGQYKGPITLRQGLRESRNIVSIKLAFEMGLNTSASYAEQFGLKLNNVEKNSPAVLSLGELENGATPLTLASAYGTFGNNGILTEPILYKKVVDKTGKKILEKKPASHKVLSPQAAYIMYDLLKEPLTYTGTNANFSPMARGKTGTSTDSKDLWFSGLTPYYSGAIWIGKAHRSNFNSTYEFGRYIGSNDTAKIWGLIMEKTHGNLPFKELSKPDGVIDCPVCKVSGEIPNPECIQLKSSYTEIFISGTEPSKFCSVHKKGVEIKDNKDKDKDKDKDKNKPETENKKENPNNTNIDNNNNNNDNSGNNSSNPEENKDNDKNPKTNN